MFYHSLEIHTVFSLFTISFRKKKKRFFRGCRDYRKAGRAPHLVLPLGPVGLSLSPDLKFWFFPLPMDLWRKKTENCHKTLLKILMGNFDVLKNIFITFWDDLTHSRDFLYLNFCMILSRDKYRHTRIFYKKLVKGLVLKVS